MAKVTVRLTMFADPYEVDEDEVDNLRHQGLLIEDQPGPDVQDEPDLQPEPTPVGSKPPVKKPTKAPEPPKES